ncbi:hypothetical protein ZWY2020_000345 [Hordeum vulgare]|nr:hypothetical protein ZWY2020_000345 [Hordeum vulgare]
MRDPLDPNHSTLVVACSPPSSLDTAELGCLPALMDHWVPPPSSLSGADAASPNPRCHLDGVRRACGRCGAAAAAAAGSALGVLLTLVFAVVGSLVGFFIGACMGMSTESGVLRGAGVGAVSGGVFCTEAVESCIEIWRSSESGKYSILFVLDIISSLFSGRIVWEKVSPALQRAVQSQMSLLSTPFTDNSDLFDTGGTDGMSVDLINKIPAIRFSAPTGSDQETDESCCCSVCLQDFGSRQFVRALPRCGHFFHVRCIDDWLQRNASCPLCRCGIHIVDHIHM